MGDSALPALVSAHSPQAKLLNLEASRPGCDPRRRRQSLQQVGSLFDQADQRVSTILVAFNALAAGAVHEALMGFKEVVSKDPGSVSAWEGLRLSAELCGDPASVAQACESLGKCMGDGAAAAEFYEQAAVLYLGGLNDEARGEKLLGLAVTSDIARFSAFDRLFRRMRDRNDGPRLLELIDLRLNVSEDVDELVKLHWERARVLRGIGEREAALQALENVTLLEPNHVGALALAAEIAISSHQLADACKYLDQLARLDAAPEKQRLMSAVAAADLYEGKLGQPEQAVSLLLALVNAGLGTLAIRERLARCAVQAANWQLAGEVSLGLAEDRETSEGRVEAARLSMSIYREKMSAPAAALPAIEHILVELPADLEVVDFLLEQPFSEVQNEAFCKRARDTLCAQLCAEPFDPESIDRLAQLAALLDDRPLRQVALGALVTLDAGSAEMLDELAALDARVARAPSIALDAQCYEALTDPDDCGPLAELFKQLAPLFNETLGPNLTALAVTKKHRLDPRAGLPLRNEIAAWAGALGLGEFDLYVGGVAADDIVGVPSEVPALVVGTGLKSPLAPEHRQAVARELFAIRQGTSILRHRTPAEVAALIVAACRLAEVRVAAPPYAMVDEFVRLLNASIPRRTRKLLPTLCAPLAGTELQVDDWFAAAIASRDRMATIAAGDISLVLGMDAPLATADDTPSLADRRRRVMPFIFSPDYLSLRARLGVAVR
jgi:tetratricopeptide (TPR) repeat protein